MVDPLATGAISDFKDDMAKSSQGSIGKLHIVSTARECREERLSLGSGTTKKKLCLDRACVRVDRADSTGILNGNPVPLAAVPTKAYTDV
jgi:hypothetical protein